MVELGKMLLMLGVILILAGGAVIVAGKLGLSLGRLPVDFSYRNKNVSFFFPFGTSILLSVLLSLALYLISRFRK